VAGAGAGAAFGPPGSGFANRFYSITILNRTIYRTEAGGSCKPFADLSTTGATSLTFTADGSAMLVTGTPLDFEAPEEKSKGTIMRITPDGKVDPKPVATGLETPMGIAVAPQTFGAYGGEIFVADAGKFEIPAPQTQAAQHDGKVYRITKAGELKLVASGLVNPSGLLFTGGHLWVTDVNGDFIGGGRELPDGFLVQIDPQ
jgi:glucose/arabinose dehydrogenase